MIQTWPDDAGRFWSAYFRYHADYESLLLDAVRLNSVGILEDFAFAQNKQVSPGSLELEKAFPLLTRVDELLLRYIPSLLLRNLCFYLANLGVVS